MKIRGTPMIYFRALNRPFLWLRVEKRLFFLNLLCSLPIAWSCMFTSLWMDMMALSIFVIGHAIGVMISRVDPLMMPLYLKHIKYNRYYLGQPTVHSLLPMIKNSVFVYEGKGGLV